MHTTVATMGERVTSVGADTEFQHFLDRLLKGLGWCCRRDLRWCACGAGAEWRAHFMFRHTIAVHFTRYIGNMGTMAMACTDPLARRYHIAEQVILSDIPERFTLPGSVAHGALGHQCGGDAYSGV